MRSSRNRNLVRRIRALQQARGECEPGIHKIYLLEQSRNGPIGAFSIYRALRDTLTNPEEREMILKAAEASYGGKDPFQEYEDNASAINEVVFVEFPEEREPAGYRFLKAMIDALGNYGFSLPMIPLSELQAIAAAR